MNITNPSNPTDSAITTGAEPSPGHDCAKQGSLVKTQKLHSRLNHLKNNLLQLTPAQIRAMDAQLAGGRDREIAAAAGVHRNTVIQWRSAHPGYMAELARRREEIGWSARNRLRSLIHTAIDVITSLPSPTLAIDQIARIPMEKWMPDLFDLLQPPEPSTRRQGLLAAPDVRLHPAVNHPLSPFTLFFVLVALLNPLRRLRWSAL